MAKLAIKKATTDVTVYLFIQASNVTTGAGLTGLTFDTASLVASYVRPLGARAALSLATLAAVDSEHSDGGFIEIDATNMPGVYRLDLPDAVCATGVNSAVVMLKGAANMAPVLLEIQLASVDVNDAVRAGISALPNAAADAAGGLPISNAGGLDMDAQIGTDIDAILEDTGTTLDTVVDTILADMADVTDITTPLAVIDVILDAIKAKTDLLNTGTAVNITSSVDGSEITGYIGATIEFALTGLGNISTYTKLYVTVKRDLADADSASIIQLEKTAGLVYINGATATTATNGTLTVDDEVAGNITGVLKPVESVKLSSGRYQYDVKGITAAGKAVIISTSEFTLADAVTKATT